MWDYFVRLRDVNVSGLCTQNLRSALPSSFLNGPRHLNVLVKRNAGASSGLPSTSH